MQDTAQVLATSPATMVPAVPEALAGITVGPVGTRTDKAVTVGVEAAGQVANAQAVEDQPDKAATVLVEADHMCPLMLEGCHQLGYMEPWQVTEVPVPTEAMAQ